MESRDLFAFALGLAKPWFVSSNELNTEDRLLEILIDFERGGTFACSECGAAGCKAYDTEERRWRHLNFFQFETILSARVPRVDCSRCGKRLVCRGRAREADSRPKSLAHAFLEKWCRWASRSRVPAMVESARTIRRHWDGVLRWFKSRINNGLLEGNNSLVQAAKARARGYRTSRNFIAMVYLIAGKLELNASHIR